MRLPTIRDAITKLTIWAGSLAILGGFIFLGSSISETIPSHAIVITNGLSEKFASPPCVINGTTDGPYASEAGDKFQMLPTVVDMKYLEARKLGFKRDEACDRAKGFEGYSQNAVMHLIWPAKSRWAEDGDWRW